MVGWCVQWGHLMTYGSFFTLCFPKLLLGAKLQLWRAKARWIDGVSDDPGTSRDSRWNTQGDGMGLSLHSDVSWLRAIFSSKMTSFPALFSVHYWTCWLFDARGRLLFRVNIKSVISSGSAAVGSRQKLVLFQFHGQRWELGFKNEFKWI